MCGQKKLREHRNDAYSERVIFQYVGTQTAMKIDCFDSVRFVATPDRQQIMVNLRFDDPSA